MSLPSASTVGRAVLLTAVSLVVINFVKPYLPQQVRNLLSA